MTRLRTPRATETSGTILKRQRARRSKGTDVGMALSFEVLTDLAYDIDCRKLVEHVALRLAEHHRDSVLAGEHPGGGAMPPLAKKSTDPNRYGRYRGGGKTFFNNDGDSAKNWLMLATTGTSVKATRKLKPTIVADGKRDGQYDHLVNKWLERGIDLQSVTGPAAAVIASAVDEFLAAAFGEQVKTPAQPGLKQEFLAQSKSRLK